MKVSCLAIVLTLAIVGSANAGITPPLINEWVANHTGADTHEYVEIIGDPFTDYSAWTILEIEGEPTATGTIDDYATIAGSVGVTGANGIFVTPFTANVLENATLTLLLVKDFAPSEGTADDIDTNDDGIIDTTFWSSISDCIAVTDEGDPGDLTYCSTVLGVSYDGLGFSPGGASRYPNGQDTDTAADWTRNAFNGEGIPALPGGPLQNPEAFNTPGELNMVPEPGTFALLSIGALCLLRRRR